MPLEDNNKKPDLRPVQSLSEPGVMALVNARSITNKSFILNDFFSSKGLEFLFLTETWQKCENHTSIIELCPTDCSFLCTPRPTGRGGDLAVFFKSCFACQLVSTESFSWFELQIIKVGLLNPFYCVLIYRPPGLNSSFLPDFNEFLSVIIRLDRVLILVDFNIHVNDNTCSFATEFCTTTESFNLTQHVSGPTHTKGNTLDLVFTLSLASPVWPQMCVF